MRFSIDVPDELVEWLDDLAASAGKSRSATVVFCARYTQLALFGVQELLAGDPQFVAAAAEFVQQPSVRQALGRVSEEAAQKVVAGDTALRRHRPYKRAAHSSIDTKVHDDIILNDDESETERRLAEAQAGGDQPESEPGSGRVVHKGGS